MTLDERISRYLARCPPAVSGSDGHGTTFKVACALVNGFALDAATAMRWMEIYNSTCCPPWKPRELRHKVQQAEKTAHTKPRGHLLGDGEKGRPVAAKLVPVSLTPRKWRFGTVGTVFPEPYANMCARTHAHMSVYRTSKQPSQPSQVENAPSTVQTTGPQPSVAFIAETTSIQSNASEEDGLVWIPGCKVPRPVEIEVDDDTWRAVDAAGFADEPLIQHALWLFPGSTVVESGVAR